MTPGAEWCPDCGTYWPAVKRGRRWIPREHGHPQKTSLAELRRQTRKRKDTGKEEAA